jgi:pyrroloquinoline quinone biosynthesis protein B
MEPTLRPACAFLLILLAAQALSSAPPQAPAAPPASPPRLIVLGTAQDGGLPHAACTCERCQRARKDPAFRRHIAGLALQLPKSDQIWLVDATPDLREQLDRVAALRNRPQGGVDRAPVDGVLLTHAHIGHYLGLAFFGFEAVSTSKLPVWASPRMAEYLRTNGPWSQLVRIENIALREFRPGEPFALGDGVTVTALQVPHRDEYSDTMAFLFKGPRRTVLYVPDTDAWRTWKRPLPQVLLEEKVSVALLDGTFYSPDELPGRDVTKIPHPLITATMDLLGPLVKSGGLKVEFIHLNHSNPALVPEGEVRKAMEARGFRVAEEGEEIDF